MSCSRLGRASRHLRASGRHSMAQSWRGRREWRRGPSRPGTAPRHRAPLARGRPRGAMVIFEFDARLFVRRHPSCFLPHFLADFDLFVWRKTRWTIRQPDLHRGRSAPACGERQDGPSGNPPGGSLQPLSCDPQPSGALTFHKKQPRVGGRGRPATIDSKVPAQKTLGPPRAARQRETP